jgi:hypothetical protein
MPLIAILNQNLKIATVGATRLFELSQKHLKRFLHIRFTDIVGGGRQNVRQLVVLQCAVRVRGIMIGFGHALCGMRCRCRRLSVSKIAEHTKKEKALNQGPESKGHRHQNYKPITQVDFQLRQRFRRRCKFSRLCSRLLCLLFSLFRCQQSVLFQAFFGIIVDFFSFNVLGLRLLTTSGHASGVLLFGSLHTARDGSICSSLFEFNSRSIDISSK